MSRALGSLCLTLVCSLAAGAQPKALFYMTTRPDSVRSFLDHAGQVDVLVPTWYHLTADGMVWGGSDPLVMRVAKQFHVSVAPIVANGEVTQDLFHKFLGDAAGNDRAADRRMPAQRLRGHPD